MSLMRCRLWPLWLLMTCGAGAGARTSSDDAPASDGVLTDQLSCMADYLRVTHRHRVDVFVNGTITDGQLSGLLRLLSGRQLFARLWRGSPASALQQEEEQASSDPSDQAVWLVPDTDSDATDALLARVRADGRRRWLLASLSGRRRGQFLGGFAQRHTYMTFRNGTTRFHRARDFHQRRPRAKGVCRGGEYKKRRRQRAGVALSRRAMEGVHLRVLFTNVSILENELEIIKTNDTITGGLCGSLLLYLQEVLGFSYSLHLVTGTENTSAWDNAVQLLHQGRGDLYAGWLAMSSSRSARIDFSSPVFPDVGGAVIDSRYMLTLTEFQITQPLQRSVWCALLVTQLLAVLVLCLIARCQQQIRRATGEPCDALDVSLWALLVLGVSCQQGAAVRSDAAASYRLAIGALYLMSLFIAACYSGNLLAEMTLARRVMPFSSLQQALEQGWRISDMNVTDAIRERILLPLMHRDLDQLPTVSAGPLEGRVIEMNTNSYMQLMYNCRDGNSCPVCLWPGALIRVPGSLAFRPGFPYRMRFNQVLRWLMERGVVTREIQRWSRHEARRVCPVGTEHRPTENRPLTVNNLQNVMAIVIYGVLTASAILVCEGIVSLLWNCYVMNVANSTRQ